MCLCDYVPRLTCGHTQVELVPGGKERPLTYEDRKEYVALAQQARLHESDAQMKALIKGVSTLVPTPLLNLFSWQDLEMRICGRTEINLDVLRRFVSSVRVCLRACCMA